MAAGSPKAKGPSLHDVRPPAGLLHAPKDRDAALRKLEGWGLLRGRMT